MNQMEIFKNPEFGSIRVIEEDGKYLFSGLDVANALGYSNSRASISRHCRYVTKRDVPHPQSPEQTIRMTFIPEGDVYRLIVHSRLPSAERLSGGCSMRCCPASAGMGRTSRRKCSGRRPPRGGPDEALFDLLPSARKTPSCWKPTPAARQGVLLRRLYQGWPLYQPADHRKELEVPERRFVRFLLNERFVYRSPSGCVLPYAKPENEGLFCVKDFYSNGYLGAYTLVTPEGKRLFATLRDQILMTV